MITIEYEYRYVTSFTTFAINDEAVSEINDLGKQGFRWIRELSGCATGYMTIVLMREVHVTADDTSKREETSK